MPNAIGIKIPITMGNTGFFNQTFTVLEETKSMILNLLLTRKGERFMQPDFGTNIYNLLFDPIIGNITVNIKNEIKDVVKTWLPHVKLEDVQVNINKENIENNTVYISVNYSLKNDTSQFDEVVVQFVI